MSIFIVKQACNIWLEILNSYDFQFRLFSRVLRTNMLKRRTFVSLFLPLISRWGSRVQTTIVITWRTLSVYIKRNTFVFCTGMLLITFPFLLDLHPLIFWVIPNSANFSRVHYDTPVMPDLYHWRTALLIQPYTFEEERSW